MAIFPRNYIHRTRFIRASWMPLAKHSRYFIDLSIARARQSYNSRNLHMSCSKQQKIKRRIVMIKRLYRTEGISVVAVKVYNKLC